MHNIRQRKVLGAACLFIMFVAAHLGCASTHVSARDLAAELSMDIEFFFKDDGSVDMGVISGGGNRATFRVGGDMAAVNSDVLFLNRRIEAGNNDIMLPDDMARALRLRFGAGPAPDTIFRVVIDPGHGGNDPGAVSRGGLREKDVVLRVSLMLAEMLRGEGYDVIMTRNSDVFISLDDRARIANESAADLFVSIHANAAENTAAHGFEIFVPADSWDNPDRGNIADRAVNAAGNSALRLKNVNMDGMSRQARVALLTALLEENRSLSYSAAADIRAGLRRQAGTNDRGTIEDRRGLRVLKFTYTPAVLVELDFLSNSEAERRLNDAQFQRRLARGIRDGIVNYQRNTGSSSR